MASTYTLKCSSRTQKNNRQKRNRHQHNTDDGGQAMGEEMRHAQIEQILKQLCCVIIRTPMVIAVVYLCIQTIKGS